MSPILGSFTGSLSFNRAKLATKFIAALGGTISEWNGWKIHTFTTTGSNTFSISSAPPGSVIDFLVVGGGGPGGSGLAGGGGAGGVIQQFSIPAEVGSYTMNIATESGAGGDRTSAGHPDGRGKSTTFTSPGGTTYTAIGGGIGGWWDGVGGTAGGCGGGGSGGTSGNPRGRVAGGGGTTGQGTPGGNGIRYPTNNANDHKGGGGGGAGGSGLNASDYAGGWGAPNRGPGAADGGKGVYTTIDGTPRYFGGGGGGSCWIGASWAGYGGIGGGGGGNHQGNSAYYGRGGGTAYNTGGDGVHGGVGGAGGANTGGGGGASYGPPWGGGAGGSGGSGIVIVRYRFKTQLESLNISDSTNLGLTEATAAVSASAIKSAWAGAPDGTYWIKPSGSVPAYKVHCYMTFEGGGWELAYRVNSTQLSPVGSGSFGAPNWAGWNYTTKAQCDAINLLYEREGDDDCISPSFVYQSFRDCMVISNQVPTMRCGYRFASQMSPCSVQLSTAGTKKTTTALFGNFNWTTSLHVRPETNRGYSGGDFFGFKVYDSTHGDGCNNGLLTGGGTDNAWGWSKAQIGIGRDNQSGSHWGGGFGCAGYACSPYESIGGGPYQKLHGHWWGHGDGRSGDYWNGDRSNGWYGHALYVRKDVP